MKEEEKKWFDPFIDREDEEITFRFIPDPVPEKIFLDVTVSRFKLEKATFRKEIMKKLFQEIVA